MPGTSASTRPITRGWTKRLDQNIGEPGEIRAVEVGSDEPGVAEPPALHNAGALGSSDLPVHRGVGHTGHIGDTAHAELSLRLTQQERQDLSLLLRAKNRKQRRSGLFIHKTDNTTHFADSTARQSS